MRMTHNNQRRAGNVLLLCALMLFVIFAITALVIDLGMVRMTQRQMQTATDSACREGLRYRDDVPPWVQNLKDTDPDLFAQMQADGIDPADPTQAEAVRRFMARNQVNSTYQDLVDPDTGKATQFGAGPLFEITGGIGQGYALQHITPPSTGVFAYKPQLQLNKGNAQEGDLVAGTFSGGPFSATVESSDYSRTDFSPAGGNDAFLVRLRRTKGPRVNDGPTNPLDDQSGVSTSGPALPLIFGQATLIPVPDADLSKPSFRRDGMKVRGTSIAQGRPALAAGTAVDSAMTPPGVRGVATFALTLTDWTTFSTANAIAFTPPPGRTMIIVGDILTGASGATIPPATSNQVYVPIVSDGTSSLGVPNGMVLGFGFVSYNPDGTLSKNAGPRIASENATSSTAVLRLLVEPIDAKVMIAVTNLTSTAAGNPNQFVLAPALVR